jgi:RNA polymerase sigma-70 factor, ECF subfamily
MHPPASQQQARDAATIERCRSGERDAFRELVERYQAYAYALAFRLVCDDERSRDIVQESFIRAWRHLDGFDLSKRFTTWLYTIVVRLAYDDIRGERRRRFLIADRGHDQPSGEDLLEGVANRELAEKIRSLVEGLPPTQRMVFVMRDLQDLSVEETAEALSLSASSVKANLSYARRRIRERMERMEKVKGTR